MKPTSSLAGKTVIITGATRGYGRALAETFHAEGARLLLTGRDDSALRSLQELDRGAGERKIAVFRADLEDESASGAIIQECIRAHGSVDAVIANAAIQGPIGPTWENDWEEWKRTISVDLLAPVALCRAAIPAMRSRGGSLILVSGGGATGPRPNFTAYACAKSALVRFGETLAQEVKGFGIRVNCIAPGAMPTDMLKTVVAAGSRASGEKENETASKTLQNGGDVIEKAVRLAAFLASDRSTGITGRLISAQWDRWDAWPDHAAELEKSDLYTLRRITGRERGASWGDL